MAGGQEQDLTEGKQAPLRFGLTALLLGNLFLSVGPWFVRMADTGPVAAGFWRMALAVPVLVLIARLTGDPVRRLTRPLFILFAVSGLFFAADLAAWHLGILQTKLANANLLGNSTSLLLPIWAFAATRTWPSRMQAAVLGLAALGAGLLMGRSFELSKEHFTGDLLCVLAGAFYTAYLILMGRVRGTMGAWPVLAWSSVMTVLPMLALALALGETIMPRDWTPLLLLALFSQILGQIMMIYAIGRVAPLLFGLTLLLQPMVSAALGWFLYGETLATLDWIGAALIGLALVLVRQPERT